jgi:hypothetical protein
VSKNRSTPLAKKEKAATFPAIHAWCVSLYCVTSYITFPAGMLLSLLENLMYSDFSNDIIVFCPIIFFS